jgi:hypothetical protein
VGFRPTGNKSSFEPQTEELLHFVRFRDRLGVVYSGFRKLVSKIRELMKIEFWVGSQGL